MSVETLCACWLRADFVENLHYGSLERITPQEAILWFSLTDVQTDSEKFFRVAAQFMQPLSYVIPKFQRTSRKIWGHGSSRKRKGFKKFFQASNQNRESRDWARILIYVGNASYVNNSDYEVKIPQICKSIHVLSESKNVSHLNSSVALKFSEEVLSSKAEKKVLLVVWVIWSNVWNSFVWRWIALMANPCWLFYKKL